jgi:Rnl2 family RNA ligase
MTEQMLESVFRSYEKIPASSKKWGLSEKEYRQLKSVEWVVTEKIHGANFVLLTDGELVRCAKRKAVLPPGEDFFGHLTVLSQLEDDVMLLFALVQERRPDVAWMAVYGELFGGGYPHPAVPQEPLVSPVQPGIYYAPTLSFCIFDIKVGTPENEAGLYLDYADVWAYCEESGVMAAAPLFVGSFEEATAYDESFETTIPERLGWPALGHKQLAEGVVIKPWRELLFAREGRPLRPVIKKKIPHFAEDIRELPVASGGPSLPAHATNVDLLRYEMMVRVTAPRMEAVISKFGRFKKKNRKQRQALLDLFVEDVLSDVREADPSLYLAVHKNDKRAMFAELREGGEALLEGIE